MASGNPFPFERLPRELRDRIYEEALVSPIEIEVYHTSTFRSFLAFQDKRSSEGSSAFNILRASQQIYSEALPVFYGQNEFHLHYINEVTKFLTDIGPRARGILKYLSLEVLMTPRSALPIFRKIVICKSLERIKMTEWCFPFIYRWVLTYLQSDTSFQKLKKLKLVILPGADPSLPEEFRAALSKPSA
ncbi:MAG: hypothetical protein M1812_007406 [Candelaria pacifica]|nr:MAG: hypothetical protein M1812_007406 [Candelaria pacifica]